MSKDRENTQNNEELIIVILIEKKHLNYFLLN